MVKSIIKPVISKFSKLSLLQRFALLFAVVVVVIGILIFLNPRFLSFFNLNVSKEFMSDMTPRCPNLLRQEGDMIMLYDLNQPASSTNPAIFHHLAEYSEFVKEQQAKGVHCPVLELQTQIVGSSISNVDKTSNKSTPSDMKKEDYDTYDKHSIENIGKFTKEDEVVDPNAISDNPMDPNWGGVQYSAQTLASGKYDGDMVSKPLYYQMGQNKTYMNPGYPGMEVVPPNYVPPDLLGEQIQTQHERS